MASIHAGVSLVSTQAAHSKDQTCGEGETQFAPVLSVDIVVCFALGGFSSSRHVVGSHLKCTRSSLTLSFTWIFSPLVKGGFRQKVQLKELEYQTEFFDWIVSMLTLPPSLAGIFPC